MGFDRWRANTIHETLLQLFQQVELSVKCRLCAARAHVLETAYRVFHLNRSMVRTRVTRSESVRSDTDKVGQLIFAIAKEVRCDGAEARMNNAAAGSLTVAGVHVIACSTVAPLAGGHATQKRHVAHPGSHPRQMFANLNAGNLRRNRSDFAAAVLRFGIERINVARSAFHEQQDATLVRLSAQRLLRCSCRQHVKPTR